MATLVPLTLNEGNAETVLITITPDEPTEDLSSVTSLALYLKTDQCQLDTALGVLVLTSADSTQLTIDSNTGAVITATAHIPATALQGAYDRFWRVDARSSAVSRTAIYGSVTVVGL